MAVKIKLKRLGKIRAPYYRIVVADSRTKRDGRAIEEIGKYHPKNDPSFIEVDSERAQHWLSVGAQPTDPVRKILEITGDWQKFKGLPGPRGRCAPPSPRPTGRSRSPRPLQETLDDSGATTKGKPRGRAADSAKAAKAGRQGRHRQGREAGQGRQAQGRGRRPSPRLTPRPRTRLTAKTEPKADAKAEDKAEAKTEPNAEATTEDKADAEDRAPRLTPRPRTSADAKTEAAPADAAADSAPSEG